MCKHHSQKNELNVKTDRSSPLNLMRKDNYCCIMRIKWLGG